MIIFLNFTNSLIYLYVSSIIVGVVFVVYSCFWFVKSKNNSVRIGKIEVRLTGIDKRFDILENRFDILGDRLTVIDKRFDALDGILMELKGNQDKMLTLAEGQHKIIKDALDSKSDENKNIANALKVIANNQSHSSPDID